jgi:hypothetical protein
VLCPLQVFTSWFILKRFIVCRIHNVECKDNYENGKNTEEAVTYVNIIFKHLSGGSWKNRADIWPQGLSDMIQLTTTSRSVYEGVSKSFRTSRLERELQMVQLSATRCNCIAILWVSLVTFAAVAHCVASQWAFIVVSVHFVIDSVRKLLDTPSYT